MVLLRFGRALTVFWANRFNFSKTFRGTWRFLRDISRWRRSGGKINRVYPAIQDFEEMAGVARGHYFFQDLIVAREVYKSAPRRHLDVGSSVSGFVAHVASFREIEVMDIRPLQSVFGIAFTQTDLMQPNPIKSDSVSCLHAIEHFGLGRYGDEIDPKGHLKAFDNLVSTVSAGGKLYISFPVSDKPRVDFNAHRVFSTEDIFSWPGAEKLTLESYWLIDDSGYPAPKATPADNIQLEFGCAIYAFRKIKD